MSPRLVPTADVYAVAIVAAAKVCGVPALSVVGARRGPSRAPIAPAVLAVALHCDRPVGEVGAPFGTGGSHVEKARLRSPQFDEALKAAGKALRVAFPPLSPPEPRADLVSSTPARSRPGPARNGTTPSPRPKSEPDRGPVASGGFLALKPAPAVTPVRAALSVDDRALIDAAVAAGKVKRLEPGRAAGTTAWEQQLHTAPPPLPSAEARQRMRTENLRAYHARRAAGLTT